VYGYWRRCCSGVYAGLEAGAAWSDTGWTFPFVESFNTTREQHFATHPNEAVVGGQVGVNLQIGGIVLGGELAGGLRGARDADRPGHVRSEPVQDVRLRPVDGYRACRHSLRGFSVVRQGRLRQRPCRLRRVLSGHWRQRGSKPPRGRPGQAGSAASAAAWYSGSNTTMSTFPPHA
jgi:hypothetical protein